ncbi:MAG TPA: aldo/keto reductase [Vicinamibacterales bacterium]|jgi:aryl-alcohol dehydrogenase-like predicted oxidoreductase
MQHRVFGRTKWRVSEIGYGMWGMAGWTGSDDDESREALDRAVDLGCNFFDTAWAYGDGKSERLLGELLRRHPARQLRVATKIPPKNRQWPARAHYALDEVFPPDYMREYTEISLRNLGVETIDLQQLHVWTDEWADDDRWQKTVASLKEEKLIRAFGISVNRWQPANVLKALRTDLVDSVQVVYNIFDQSPEDELFPECERRNIAVIARVPFDEGSLTGTLTADSTWPEGDFRNIYFQPENLRNTLERVERLQPVVPDGMTLPELALRHILQNPAISTVIPGMRKVRHVEANMRVSDSEDLPEGVILELRDHRWDRWIDIP